MQLMLLLDFSCALSEECLVPFQRSFMPYRGLSPKIWRSCLSAWYHNLDKFPLWGLFLWCIALPDWQSDPDGYTCLQFTWWLKHLLNLQFHENIILYFFYTMTQSIELTIYFRIASVLCLMTINFWTHLNNYLC